MDNCERFLQESEMDRPSSDNFKNGEVTILNSENEGELEE